MFTYCHGYLDLSPRVTQPRRRRIAAVNPQHPDKLLNDEFEIDVPVNNPNGKYVPGQKAWVRFKLGRQPLYWQWGRKLLQNSFQTKQQSPLV